MPGGNAETSPHISDNGQPKGRNRDSKGEPKNPMPGGPSTPISAASPYLTPPAAPSQTVALPVIDSSRIVSHQESGYDVSLLRSASRAHGLQRRDPQKRVKKAHIAAQPTTHAPVGNREPRPRHQTMQPGPHAASSTEHRQDVGNGNTAPRAVPGSPESTGHFQNAERAPDLGAEALPSLDRIGRNATAVEVSQHSPSVHTNSVQAGTSAHVNSPYSANIMYASLYTQRALISA